MFTWPVNNDFRNSGNRAIKKLCEHFRELLVKNSCNITKDPSKCLTLKT